MMINTNFKQYILSNITKIEFFRYIIGGIIITLTNILLFTILILLDIKYYIANLVAITVAKICGYFINKEYVYKIKNLSAKENTKQIFNYFLWRGLSGILEYFLLILFVTIFKFQPIYSKYFITVVIILFNYFSSKKFVFKKNT